MYGCGKSVFYLRIETNLTKLPMLAVFFCIYKCVKYGCELVFFENPYGNIMIRKLFSWKLLKYLLDFPPL